MKLINLLLEKLGDSYDYGCAMLKVSDPPKFLYEIDPNDLYEESGDQTYGFEDEPHITLLYGFHNGIDSDHIKKVLDEFTFPQSVVFDKPSLFEKEKYDVLKLDIKEPFLNKVHEALKVYDHKESAYDYDPHVTIAYLKSGLGKKYIKIFSKKDYGDKSLRIEHAIYSSYNGKKYKIPLK